MQNNLKKYQVNIPGKKLGAILLFLFLNTMLQAQETPWADSIIKELKYELDTTVTVQADQPADSIEEDEDYTEESKVDTKIEPEYFLRKEFTGGLTDTLNFRRLHDSVLKALRQDKAFWYANEIFKKREKKKEKASLAAHPVFQTILWLIIVSGFAMFLILYLSGSNVSLFRKSGKITDEETGLEASDIFSINYQKEIDKAVSANNYRLAVRLMFLRLLRDLSAKNIIDYKQDSTNFDYMMQLRSTEMYPDFFRLTRNYEYSWYGQFEIDKEKYSIIKNEFQNFDRKLNR